MSEITVLKERVDAQLSIAMDDISPEELQLLLTDMMTIARKIRETSNRYPEKPISAAVWMEGAALASSAQMLTDYLHETTYLEYEAQAAQIWANVTLSVCGHYHHLVGPAMLANAKIAERMDNIDFAMQAYKAVLNDFTSLLEDCEIYGYTPDGDTATAINCLKEAVDNLVRLYDGSEECAKAIEVQKRIEKILSD